MESNELAVLKSKIGILRTLYAVLFGLSMVLLLLPVLHLGFGAAGTILWAGALGGAVATRLWRSSLVNRYNAAITSGPAQLQ